MLRPTVARVIRASRVTRQIRKGSSHSGPHYDPPSGWFLNQNPAEPVKKEAWEPIFFYGFCGSLLAAGVAYAYKPDTSIQTWALEEARRRLETEGVIPDSTKPRKITEVLKTVSGK
ncbi:NADH:ubiquinone oxidoreductase 11.6kD subunit [Pyronema domesticum]|uniref:NADH dehydrogenase [ubiquinone] 1 beta subcomplex subunit 11, mitochondrial n=1 Tax=Pyronema omphalodes (strain CBS 100304) TaxID=1076935 RepID=U4LKR8_PYROM|nr:NADH:ubiquinone oxidoreductase 11.6kD subunit [Pyronema domesticum]CCX32172.1 Similar to hypothetical protein [Tuber melanosporum Mel28]; acc. no. XP_002837420 [Pyronema omphalodes CBS 100304]